MQRVVIVVDMLNGFCNIGNLASSRTSRIIPNIAMLLQKESRRGSSIIFVADNHDADDKEFKIWPPHCVKGTKEAEVIDQLRPLLRGKNAFLIPKKTLSGFFQTDLEKILNRLKPEQVIVVGVCTDICVLYAVFDLRMRGYKVIVPKDCVETFDSPDHPAEKVNEVFLNHMRTILGVEISDKAEGIS